MIVSDINLLTPIVTLAVGIALGYGFRGLIAREERATYVEMEKFNNALLTKLKQIATSKLSRVEPGI